MLEQRATRSYRALDDPQRGRRKLPRAVRERQMLGRVALRVRHIGENQLSPAPS